MVVTMEILVRITENRVPLRMPEPVDTAWSWSIWKHGLKMKGEGSPSQCVRTVRAAMTYKAGV